MTYEDFIAQFENVKKSGKGVMVKCPSHDDRSASLSISRSTDGGVLLKCFAGCKATDVVGAMGLGLRDLFATERAPANHNRISAPVTLPKAPTEKAVIETVYSYTDELGREVYQALRLKPKSFRQRHSVAGEWVWNMDGVERVLYRLPEVIKADTVWIVEGEKDADNLALLGYCATCNVGGAGKWLDAYTERLAGKDLILCGDNDDPGRKHMDLVYESVSTKARSVKFVKFSMVKDVSDFIATFSVGIEAKHALDDLVGAAVPHVGGHRLPIYSMADIEPLYQRQVEQSRAVSLDLGNWLPSLRKIRPVIPGELVLLLGDTGSGKTAMLQNIAVRSGLKSLLFEMELPVELVYERFFAIRAGLDCVDIEQEYRGGGSFGRDAVMKQFPNLFVCPESRITLDDLESLIVRSELKIGCKPVLVLVDYVQLLQGRGDRYQRTSDAAEGLKVIAKATKTIIVIASQVGRAEEEITLHSGKDSGALENSAGLVIGAWRTSDDPTLLTVKVLKCTKGGAGLIIPCNFFGRKMTINERSPIANEDVPATTANPPSSEDENVRSPYASD